MQRSLPEYWIGETRPFIDFSQSIRWTQLEIVGDKPTGRAGHTVCTVGTKHVMFGGVGRDASGTPRCFNDVYVLEPNQDEPKASLARPQHLTGPSHHVASQLDPFLDQRARRSRSSSST